MQVQIMVSQSMHQRAELRMEQRQQQAIELSTLLSFPDEVITKVAEAATTRPEEIENMLKKRKEEKTGKERENEGEKARTIYGSLMISKGAGNPLAGNGMIIAPDVEAVEGCLGDCQTVVTPDVKFIGRKLNKPEVVFSEHIVGSMKLVMQMDSAKYPNTSRLLSRLAHFDEWKRRTLRNAYVIMGNAQREYFEDFDSSRCRMFVQKNMADELEIDASTVSRIFANRWVEAKSVSGMEKCFGAKELFVSVNDLQKYLAIPVFNQLLKKEFDSKVAFRDDYIAFELPNLARRTVVKYRAQHGIPDYKERGRLYSEGKPEKPFRITSAI